MRTISITLRTPRFFHDVRFVNFNRAVADAQLFADLLGVQTQGQMRQHFAFAPR